MSSPCFQTPQSTTYLRPILWTAANQGHLRVKLWTAGEADSVDCWSFKGKTVDCWLWTVLYFDIYAFKGNLMDCEDC